MLIGKVGEISGAVRVLEEELDYYKKLSKEQQEVIEQVHRGYALPGQPTYIHPMDLAELCNEATIVDVCHSLKQYEDNILVVKGVKFKQSAAMPKITTKFN